MDNWTNYLDAFSTHRNWIDAVIGLVAGGLFTLRFGGIFSVANEEAGLWGGARGSDVLRGIAFHHQGAASPGPGAFSAGVVMDAGLIVVQTIFIAALVFGALKLARVLKPSGQDVHFPDTQEGRTREDLSELIEFDERRR